MSKRLVLFDTKMKMEVEVDPLSELLAGNNIFGKIKPTDLEELKEKSSLVKLKKGEFLCHQGYKWSKVILVKNGELSWTLLSVAGKEKILFTIRKGEDFWTHSFLDGKPMPASLKVIKDSEVFLWSDEVILPIMYRNPEAIWALNARLVGIMRRAREIIYGLAFQPVASRLARLFLERFLTEDEHAVERDLTLSQIAGIISSSPQVVCKLMYQFHEDGLLEISRATIKLQDIETLRKLSEAS
jgi:CRP-like cAMP-binding protein